MRVLKDFYFYPWVSPQENNANTLFIDGQVPTLVDPGHSHLFGNMAEAMARDRIDIGRIKLLLFTHGHPDHVEATDRFDDAVSGASAGPNTATCGRRGRTSSWNGRPAAFQAVPDPAQ